MKEGLIHIPDDIIVLREKFDSDGRKLEELPLGLIPDGQAPTLNKQIEFVKNEQEKGNLNPLINGSFDRNDDWKDGVILYRVVLKGSYSAANLDLPGDFEV